VLLLEGGTLKGAQIFSQEQESRLESWRERRELKLWISRRFFVFLSGQWLKEAGGGLFIAPPQNSRWGAFHRTSPVRPPNKSGGPL
jgi:hypothetical protein